MNINDYKKMYPYLFDQLDQAESKAERLSYKQRIIEDIKRSEYPKGITKEMVKQVKAI